MKKTFYFLLIIGVIISSCESDSEIEKPQFELATPSEFTELEYEIYSLILNEEFSDSNIVINQQTRIITDVSILDNGRFELDDSLIQSYLESSSNEFFLDDKFNYKGGEINMISSAENEYFFDSEGENWEEKANEFDEYFPNSRGVIQFSRIGFNNDFTEALVQFSRMDYLSGDFIIYYLNKNGENWELNEFVYIITCSA